VSIETERPEPTSRNSPPRDAEITGLSRCKRCDLTYAPTKSTSALKLTYCSFLCELGDLGFSMSGLEHMQRKQPEAPPEPILELEPVATP
jgi:hypothetical protein